MDSSSSNRRLQHLVNQLKVVLTTPVVEGVGASSLMKNETAAAAAPVAAGQKSAPKKIGTTDEGAAVARGLGGSSTSDDDNPYAIEGVFVDLDQYGIPMVGTDADLAEDYVAGLNLMASRVDPKLKMGYVDTVESGHILMVTNPKVVTKVRACVRVEFGGGGGEG